MRNSARSWKGVLALVWLAWAAGAAWAAAPPPPPFAAAPPAMMRTLQGSGLPLSSFGIYVQPVDAALPVASINAESAYVLASTAKIVTSLAALDLLGTRYRWRTQAFVNGPIEGGRLRGDLIIVGGGNAQFTSADLKAWLQRMRAAGLEEVMGDILLDRSAFALHAQDHRHTPQQAANRPRHVWPAALSLDEGVVQVMIQSTGAGRAGVHTMPPLQGVQLVNNVLAGGGCRSGARWAQAAGASPQLVVEGRWAAACGPGVIALVPPAQADFVVHAVAGLWAEVGGRLHGRVRPVDLTAGDPQRDRLPLNAADGLPLLPWSTHLSEPLPSIVRDMNKSSNNVTARHLMLSLARGFPLRAASLDSAQSSVQAWLRRQGLADGDISIENGSGLSREERGRPRALVQLLLNAWRSRDAGTALIDSLPVAGIDGTLQHRLQHGAATGRAFLKTGSLLDARALAGYVQGASGQVYAVAALVNHPRAARATPALDALIEWIARYG